MNRQHKGSIPMDEKTGNYWRILETNLEWIRYSDAKATGILTIYGVLITVAFTNVLEIMEIITSSWILIVFNTLSAITSLAAIFYGFRAISPRVVAHDEHSIIFFGSIVSHSKDVAAFRQITHRVLDSRVGLDDDLAGQIYINAQIASQKFRNVSASIRYFTLSLLLLLVQMPIYYLLTY